ncbi:hypothetical protein F8M41_024596 [Gigaspora margarita]|uniref:Peptidase S1 domain-containing protein n=1 Tax=Gigaspora margarita TaxID=4874 RepID=A0A8H3XK12_GIGMA|nr:hypothetical protein F8M41_024596 [Gigaspora margarita]
MYLRYLVFVIAITFSVLAVPLKHRPVVNDAQVNSPSERSFSCGGTILDENIIIAAHCVNRPENLDY